MKKLVNQCGNVVIEVDDRKAQKYLEQGYRPIEDKPKTKTKTK